MKPKCPILYLLAFAAQAQTVEVASPNTEIAVRFSLDQAGRPAYAVNHKGKPLILPSGLGLTLEGSGFLGAELALASVTRSERRGSWKPLYGERSVIPENYREALIEMQDRGGRRLQIAIRAYDEGAALRYGIPKQDAIGAFQILSEHTEFRLPEGTRAWETHGAQQQYENVWTTDLQPRCERPLVIEYPSGGYAALLEAGVLDYARMLFSPAPGRPGTLISELSAGPKSPGASGERAGTPYVWGTTPFSTPWRVILAAERPGDLIERNYLVLNLSPPSTLADTSWIKPGKAIREVTLSTRGGRECVDFARARNLQYVEFDAGWYGRETDDRADATGVSIDPARLSREPAYQGLNLAEVIDYAEANGIGVLLYVNRRALERQALTLFPLYEKWGVKGVKFGFVNVGSQYWTKWLYDTVELAARHKLVVDIHDEHRPTGLSRTLPNLLTQEGILGNEGMPPADHNTVLPFTRFVAGAADYTVCYYNDRIKTTRAHQLALTVVYYSPLQFLYWYDRPAAYTGEPEIEFFDRVPTVWDETRVIDGRIGRYIAVARRSGKDWFVGVVNNGVPRKVAVPLSFLPAGEKFLAHIYENAGRPREVAVSTRPVDARAVITTAMPAGGGQAVWLEPK